MKKIITREEWLMKAIEELSTGVFKRARIKLPEVKASVGFAYGSEMG